MTDSPASVDEYLSALKSSQCAELSRIRSIIKRIAPEATETISYGMPTYMVAGKRLIYFAAFKNHMSLFGSLGEVEEKLGDYKLSHRGTVQFTEEHPLPDALIEEIVRTRLREITHETTRAEQSKRGQAIGQAKMP